MPYNPPPELATLDLAAIAQLVAERKLPPVDQWHPSKTGDSEICITADGRWFHQGGEIRRPAMVRAFSSLLRREADGSYHLVTPQERLSIAVEDAPFIAVECLREGYGPQSTFAFRLNTDDLVIAGPDHGIETRPFPYLHVRGDLWAKFSRPVYYELAEIALEENPDVPGIWSDGEFFALGAAE
ncbi:DUF1285 domain-containing protein [Sphingorhabdus pulchriflava]|uniref:DUF1285 domain-containing protein n=1 Tax=Sphingorhabdus pulchriflava TaxID=2292257 RepID=A0A371BHS5_9SPHN|nr:DUF1285 domain-containing protein [Sphingorhabdus pulchriflava]RDV07057.1 DUF1285 domain-containing protein [Sphingorhabdus pulchriflava]